MAYSPVRGAIGAHPAFGKATVRRGENRVGLVALAVPVAIFRALSPPMRRSGVPPETFMFITPAHAQAPGASAPDLFMSLLPFVLIFVIMWFLIIRPQRLQMKKRDEMLKNIRRNDIVVTGGGVIAKVTKVVEGDAELEVEIAQGVKVKVLRLMVADVRAKGEPQPANDSK
jgi:preprotein translocase subunit YajC